MIAPQVVVTGAGSVSSIGATSSETWTALLGGQNGIRPVRGFDAGGFGRLFAAQVGDLTAENLGIHPRDARIMDLHSLMLMSAARQAYGAAGLADAGIAGDAIGFFAGMGMVDYEVDDILPAVLKSLGPAGVDYGRFYAGAYRDIHPLWPLSMLNNVTFCQVAIDLGIKGENAVFCPHADSGAVAITEAVGALCEERAEAVLTGGVSEKISPLSIARGLFAEILKRAPEEPGTVLGEGAAILCLENRASADRRGATYSVAVAGYGHCCAPRDDGTAPLPGAIAGAMSAALERASLQPKDIDVVIVHRDGTEQADKSEDEGLLSIFGDLRNLPVFSTKPAFGHLLAAAPAMDIVVATMMIERGIIPPIWSGKPAQQVRNVMVNCQSYEGQCATIIVQAVA